MDHHTIIYGCLTRCKNCNQSWNTNDPYPPSCILSPEEVILAEIIGREEKARKNRNDKTAAILFISMIVICSSLSTLFGEYNENELLQKPVESQVQGCKSTKANGSTKTNFSTL